MRGKWFVAGFLAVVGVLAWTAPLQAGGHGGHHGGFHHGGFHHGGFHNFHGGFHNFHGGFHNFRAFHHPFIARPFVARSFFHPFFAGGFVSPFFWGGFYPYYGLGYGGYGYPGYDYGYYGPYSGLSGSVYPLVIQTSTVASPAGDYSRTTTLSAPSMKGDDGTYPYDGGPKNPIPNPKAAPAPTDAPQRTVPLEGRSVSLPKPATKWAYPAYGETARRTSFAEDRTYLTKNEPKNSNHR